MTHTDIRDTRSRGSWNLESRVSGLGSRVSGGARGRDAIRSPWCARAKVERIDQSNRVDHGVD